MERKRDGLRHITDAFGDLRGLVKTVQEASLKARHHYRLVDQVVTLFRASETDPEPGFIARWLMLCTLPRSNSGSREKYVRRNGPYTLVMTAGHLHRLPFGNLPRLLVARCEFPAPIRSGGSLRWRASEVEAWLAGCQARADEIAADRATTIAAAAERNRSRPGPGRCARRRSGRS